MPPIPDDPVLGPAASRNDLAETGENACFDCLCQRSEPKAGKGSRDTRHGDASFRGLRDTPKCAVPFKCEANALLQRCTPAAPGNEDVSADRASGDHKESSESWLCGNARSGVHRPRWRGWRFVGQGCCRVVQLAARVGHHEPESRVTNHALQGLFHPAVGTGMEQDIGIHL